LPVDELMNRAQRRAQRKLREDYRSLLEQERNGRPIDPEMAARMTQQKEPEPLFQVGVTVRETGKVVFLGPMMCADACGQMVEAVNRQILTQGRRDWTKAEAYPMTPISPNGVN